VIPSRPARGHRKYSQGEGEEGGRKQPTRKGFRFWLGGVNFGKGLLDDSRPVRKSSAWSGMKRGKGVGGRHSFLQKENLIARAAPGVRPLTGRERGRKRGPGGCDTGGSEVMYQDHFHP